MIFAAPASGVERQRRRRPGELMEVWSVQRRTSIKRAQPCQATVRPGKAREVNWPLMVRTAALKAKRMAPPGYGVQTR